MKSRRPEFVRALRAAGAIGAASLCLSACSSDGGNDWRALWTVATNSWSGNDSKVGLDQAGAIPFATLGIRIDDGPEQILILATDNGTNRLWTSSARVALETRKGRVMRTIGFIGDVSGSVLRSTEASWSVPGEFRWSADFADMNRYAIAIVCHDQPVSTENIEILGKTIGVLRVEEDCRADELDWSFHNTYWVNADTGRVWRSIQHVHPGGQTLELEMLRPTASPG
jgi:hypothetical protein